MPVQALDDDNARDFLAGNPLSFVLFRAPWCGTCRSFAPVFARVADRHEDLAFCEVDTSKSPEVRGAFGVGKVPHLAVVHEQQLAFSHTGPLEEEALEAVVRQVREQASAPPD